MTARKLAYRVLMDIEINKNYSNISLNSFLRDSKLNDSDRGFTTELVYGVLENKIYLDYIINQYSKIKVKKMAHSVKIVLRMGVYQLIFLQGSKDYASINESVKIIKKIDYKSSGFVNAVLRNIARDKEKIRVLKEDSIENISIKYSFERWIVEKLVEQYGFNEAIDIVKSLSLKPRIYLRINMLKKNEFNSFEDLKKYIISELEKEKISVREVEDVNEALEVENIKSIEDNILFRNGYISVQDLSSMMVAKALNPNKDVKVLDVCAAPGGKSMHICEMLENSGQVISCDIYKHKIKLIKSYVKRLGVKNNICSISDALKLDQNKLDSFDYILCDVPCSGMGIVRRKPEIKYKKEEDLQELPKIQYNILENASKYLKKGGVIIYSTCTIFKEENIDIINKFLENNKEFELDIINNLEFINKYENAYINILPNKVKMDGFFICRMKKI
ncbi:16S rRNA (cytosine(967)-C(5))-methyltransferase RsmB [Peptostreptococcus equinus]|uniref:16S rRNA (cytosine(967)-C(5))-methyltransferase n=1 Tax=Peptostreptococcus equinus TaxID=3003601 RepID=A0ABY7JLM4_9FIRM|nr:16S rRNA (cytosine(967)-C(5))-methyltransferase RsmB [Peptostreptococcus sp. CBA3647]WAW14232.1 16S rRNA (cytosine(967)-C(5))-methyltransferase RsmB [Peptostreptococcus sp. CBA3647]